MVSPTVHPAGGKQANEVPPTASQAAKARRRLFNKPLQKNVCCVNVLLMDGQTLPMPVRVGETVQSLAAEVLSRKGQPYDTIQFVQETRLLSNTEQVCPFVGSTVNAVITKSPLSGWARKLLGRCGGDPDAEHIQILEIPFKLEVDDMGPLFELLCQLQPQRLIIGSPPLDETSSFYTRVSLTPGCLERLAGHLSCPLPSLRGVALYPTTPEDVPHLGRLLRRCPSVQQCDLTGTTLTPEDVRHLRKTVDSRIIV